MINTKDILETIKMIEEEHLDIRTITMGISLRDLAADDINVLADKVYDKVTRRAEKLVATGEQIERELGIPIINKRISVTPIAMVGATSSANSYVPLAKALDRAAETTGVNFVGGFSALVQKGFAKGDEILINPVIEKKTDPFPAEEGCLSLVGTRKTTRYRKIQVFYQDRRFRKHRQTFTGWTAQIIQHECDHLDGIII